MRALYSLIIYLATPFIILRLLWRARKNPAYSKRWHERFAWFNSKPLPPSIWLHAVSLGEVNAAAPLIKKIQQCYPQDTLVITCMTPTGSLRVQQLFSDQVHHSYLAYDNPCAVNRFLKQFNPKIAIIMETELWPNYFYYCAKKHIPILIANARLSDQSIKSYRYIRFMTRPMLEKVTVAAQSRQDADRFKMLGALENQLTVTGNIKFDVDIPDIVRDQGRQLRAHLGEQRFIWIGASTHAGEEKQILDAFNIIKKTLPETILILVPRHPERFDEVAVLCRSTTYKTIRRTEMEKTNLTQLDILLGDTMGELLLMYAASDVAFVGGSLIPHGGHNILEPVLLNIPVITGPHTFNFSDINQQFMQAEAYFIIKTPEQLASAVLQLLQNKNLHQQTTKRAQEIIAANRGALEKHMKLIETLLN